MSPVSSGKSKSGEHRRWHRHPATVRRERRFGATPGSGFRAGLRNRQSLGRPIPAGENMLARYGPITLRSYVGSDTACALLYTKLQREDAAMMETALDRPAADSTLPPEVRRCRGHAPTREAPDARRAGRCRQRLPEVRNGVERAWKAALRRCGRVVRVVRQRSASRFREHLPGSRARPTVHPGRLAPLVQREATGTASIEDGASLSLPPDERDTTRDLRGVVTCRDDPRRIGVAGGRDPGTGARPENQRRWFGRTGTSEYVSVMRRSLRSAFTSFSSPRRRRRYSVVLLTCRRLIRR